MERFKITLKTLSLSLLLYIGTQTGIQAEPVGYRLNGEHGKRQVVFYSNTSLEGFEGAANQINGVIQVDFSKKNLGLSGKISVPVMSMNTGITMRDVHMRGKDWLNENRYPNIQFDLLGIKKVKKKGKDKWFVNAKGRITVKGRSKDVDVPVTIKRKKTKKGDFIYVKGSFKVFLKDHGVNGPFTMKMIGAKVSPDIKVTLKIKAKNMGEIGKSKKSW